MKNGKEESANDALLQIRHLQLIQSSYKTVFRKNPSIIIYEKGTSKIILRIGIQIKKKIMYRAVNFKFKLTEKPQLN